MDISDHDSILPVVGIGPISPGRSGGITGGLHPSFGQGTIRTEPAPASASPSYISSSHDLTKQVKQPVGSGTLPVHNFGRAPKAMSRSPPEQPATRTKSNPKTNYRKPSQIISSHELQDYQIQLMLLEAQNKKRLMMNRQGLLGEEAAETPVDPDQELEGYQKELIHYTISEDATAMSPNKRLYAIEKKPPLAEPVSNFTPRRLETQTGQGTPRIKLAAEQPLPQTRQGDQKKPSSQQLGVPLQPLTSKSLTQRFVPGIVASRPTIGMLDSQSSQQTQLRLEQTGTGEEDMMQAQRAVAPPKFDQNPSPMHHSQGDSLAERNNATAYRQALGTTGDMGGLESYPAGGYQSYQESLSEDSSGNPVSIPDFALQEIIKRLLELETENNQLKSERNKQCSSQAENVRIQVFHCLLDDSDSDYTDEADDTEDYRGPTYLAEPYWEVRGDEVILRGHFHVPDPDGYVEKQGDISFVIYKWYSVEHQRSQLDEAIKSLQPLPMPEPAQQVVLLVSDEMVSAIEAFFGQDSLLSEEFPFFMKPKRMRPPYFWWYDYREAHRNNALNVRQAQLVHSLTDWIESTYSTLYNRINDQFLRLQVSPASLQYLLRPGQVIISSSGDTSKGYLVVARASGGKKIQEVNRDKYKRIYKWSWEIKATSLAYQGEFYWRDEVLRLELEAESEWGEVDITSLGYVPLDYASSDVRQKLERRGQTFWKCRDRQLVSYEAGPTNSQYMGQRFMVDFNTYTKLHHTQRLFLDSDKPKLYKPRDGQIPKSPEIYVFPEKITGFDLRRKKWENLEIDRIQEVHWNEQAFSNLVADKDTKEMILALVTNQLATEKGTDLIENKGNGLILLLHGSPGTGKTYTAESVAEIAKKPLYPVTCGDIGTEPEAVEKYLESVFYLGKKWDCVVLLDEAEIFLEQRTLQDLKRNALVSVFLRALEYYEGILILTTNRVGTFDEAFKSRIQLALRYEKLNKFQRKQIWQNFFTRLKDLGEGDSIDFDDVQWHINELAQYPMNGRQIRNSISTGRQLAKYLKEKMTFSHLQRAITLSEKFDRYLAEVREGDLEEGNEERGEDGRYSDEYFAREGMVR